MSNWFSILSRSFSSMRHLGNVIEWQSEATNFSPNNPTHEHDPLPTFLAPLSLLVSYSPEIKVHPLLDFKWSDATCFFKKRGPTRPSECIDNRGVHIHPQLMGKIVRFNRKPQCRPQSPWVRDPNGADVTSRLDDWFILEISCPHMPFFFLTGLLLLKVSRLSQDHQETRKMPGIPSNSMEFQLLYLGEMGQLTFEPCNVDQHWWLLVWGCSMELSNFSQVIIQLTTLI